jgi:hypothetical protein
VHQRWLQPARPLDRVGPALLLDRPRLPESVRVGREHLGPVWRAPVPFLLDEWPDVTPLTVTLIQITGDLDVDQLDPEQPGATHQGAPHVDPRRVILRRLASLSWTR